MPNTYKVTFRGEEVEVTATFIEDPSVNYSEVQWEFVDLANRYKYVLDSEDVDICEQLWKQRDEV